MTKSYGKVQALHSVSFDVKPGEVFGLIGPDGAGKTTMYRLLCSLLVPDAGTLRVDGFDVVTQMQDVRRRVGYMPGRFSLYQDLTVEENLHFFATLFGTTVEENYATIASIYTQIEPFRQRKAGALSGGMKQKLGLACTLVRSPKLLLLDEPSMGLAPLLIKEIFSIIVDINKAGTTILLVEQNANMALSIANRAYVLETGRITLSGDAKELAASEDVRKAYLGG